MSSKSETNVYDFLKKRGFIAQVTNEERVRNNLSKPGIKFYIGFDPTADSLHVGHFLLMMVIHYLQKFGHKPYILIGGGTGFIGDPSGRSDMRKMMDPETIEHNCNCFRKQMSNLISFEGENAAEFVNNADWLLKIKWIDFLRTIGVHFSVNRMLAAEAFKTRFATGLSFFELNYMLMQAYDFLYLFDHFGVSVEFGGNDQWSNIIAGSELIRKVRNKDVDGVTITILTKADGTKMGKTAGGALWLDPQKVSPYHFYQYWLNIDDLDVEKCLKLFSSKTLEEIHSLMETYTGKDIVRLKSMLAFEITANVHGQQQALLAQKQSVAGFEKNDSDAMFAIEIKLSAIDADPSVANMLVLTKLVKSKSLAKSLIESGAVSLNAQKITDIHSKITAEMITKGEFTLFKGKKNRIKIIITK